MNSLLKSFAIGLVATAGLAISAISGHAQNATATISGVPVAGGFNYTVTLDNTGSTVFNSFWFGWIQFLNDLPAPPSLASNSLGWNNNLFGNSIQYINSTGTPLAAGHTATFTFFDTATPTAMTTAPSPESVAYVNGIDNSQGVAGDSTGIITPTLVAAPEPSSVGLIAAGLLGLLFRTVRKK
jgi:PEP-CTERM motif-containing protein